MVGKVRNWFPRGSFLWFVCVISALMVAVIVVGIPAIYWFYNYVPVWGGQTLRQVFQVGTTWILTLLVSIVATVVTIAMAYYAYATVNEMRKDRKKDSIEKVLLNAYSPLYEIFRRARFLDERNSIREMEPRTQYVLEEDEFKEVREILKRPGYYLGAQVRRGVTNALDKFDIKQDNGKKYYRILGDIERYWDHIEKRLRDLEKELEELNGVSSRQGDV